MSEYKRKREIKYRLSIVPSKASVNIDRESGSEVNGSESKTRCESLEYIISGLTGYSHSSLFRSYFLFFFLRLVIFSNESHSHCKYLEWKSQRPPNQGFCRNSVPFLFFRGSLRLKVTQLRIITSKVKIKKENVNIVPKYHMSQLFIVQAKDYKYQIKNFKEPNE